MGAIRNSDMGAVVESTVWRFNYVLKKKRDNRLKMVQVADECSIPCHDKATSDHQHCDNKQAEME